MNTTDEQEVDVKIEGAQSITVGPAVIEALRQDARRQAEEGLRDAGARWRDCDIESVDDLRSVGYRLSAAAAAIDALVYLAPDESDADA